MEGTIILEYDSYSDDLINILLRNGYSLSMELIDNNQNIKILYCK